MYGGRIVAVVDGRTADKNEVGLLMATGGSRARTRRRAPASPEAAAMSGTARTAAAPRPRRRWSRPRVGTGRRPAGRRRRCSARRRRRRSSCVSELLVPGKAFDPGCRSPPTRRCSRAPSAARTRSSRPSSTRRRSSSAAWRSGFGFKAGLFNIGAQGQFLMGALGAVIVGVWVGRLAARSSRSRSPSLAGIAAGAAWGFIPGFLKAVSGAHEVVSTIMLNYIAVALLAALVSGPAQGAGSPSPVTFDVGQRGAARSSSAGTATSGSSSRSLAAVFVWWLLYRTTWGFEIRAVGANPDAARYAGMRPRPIIVATMTFAARWRPGRRRASLLGVTHTMTVELRDDRRLRLDRGRAPRPLEPGRHRLLAALLFGAMRAGAGLMQIQARIPVELVDVLQATILLFLVAGPVLRRARLRGVETGRRCRDRDAPARSSSRGAGRLMDLTPIADGLYGIPSSGIVFQLVGYLVDVIPPNAPIILTRRRRSPSPRCAAWSASARASSTSASRARCWRRAFTAGSWASRVSPMFGDPTPGPIFGLTLPLLICARRGGRSSAIADLRAPRLAVDLPPGGPDHQRHDHQHRRVRPDRLPRPADLEDLARRRRQLRGLHPAGRAHDLPVVGWLFAMFLDQGPIAMSRIVHRGRRCRSCCSARAGASGRGPSASTRGPPRRWASTSSELRYRNVILGGVLRRARPGRSSASRRRTRSRRA